jgi:hypothetical protein
MAPEIKKGDSAVFIENEISFMELRVTSDGSCHELDESNPQTHTLFL